MKKNDVLVVGGSAAGLTAAMTARRHYASKSIALVRREKKVSIPCGIPLINTVSACISQRMTADDIATFQTGTHPALTASPVAYQLVNAAEIAIGEMQKKRAHG